MDGMASSCMFRPSAVLCTLLLLAYRARAESIFSSKTGPIISLKNVQDPKYLVNYVPASASMEVDVDPEHEVVYMTNSIGEKFMCVLPPPLDEESGDGHNASKVAEEKSREKQKSPEDLLDILKSLPCFYRVEGWWTYELCYKRHIRQYHIENEQMVAEFYMGHYSEEETAKLHEGEGGSFLQKDPRSQTAAQRYHAHVYTNGTACDLTSDNRTAQVRYVCAEDGDYIAVIKEAPSCQYTIVFYTTILCHHPLFQKEALPINMIYCHALPAGRPSSKDSQGQHSEAESRAEDWRSDLQDAESPAVGTPTSSSDSDSSLPCPTCGEPTHADVGDGINGQERNFDPDVEELEAGLNEL